MPANVLSHPIVSVNAAEALRRPPEIPEGVSRAGIMRPRRSQDDGAKTAEDPPARKLWGTRLLLYVTVLSRLTLIISANWLSTANSFPNFSLPSG